MEPTVEPSANLIGAAIDEMLREFVEQPFLNAREYDYQAVLFAKLRARFPHPVPMRFVMNPSTASEHEWIAPKTARVHGESCIGQKGITNGYVNVDLIVFHDGMVTLPCHEHGPTALQETVQLADLDAVIEVKNAPSANLQQAREFVNDIARLARLQQQNQRLLCYAVVIDQSISLPSAKARKVRPRNWLALVAGLRAHSATPDRPFVEVCYVSPADLAPARTFFSVPSEGEGAHDSDPLRAR